MHVVFSPSLDPVEVQINVDCLSAATVEKTIITYHSIPDTVPCPISYEEARSYNRKGNGANLAPNLDSRRSSGGGVGELVGIFDPDRSSDSINEHGLHGGSAGAKKFSPGSGSRAEYAGDLLSTWAQATPDSVKGREFSNSSFVLGTSSSRGSPLESPNDLKKSDPGATDSPMHRQLARHLGQYLSSDQQ
jgi:hypothetical protein